MLRTEKKKKLDVEIIEFLCDCLNTCPIYKELIKKEKLKTIFTRKKKKESSQYSRKNVDIKESNLEK